MEILRGSDETKANHTIERMMKQRETKEIVVLAKKDAEALTMEEIKGGKISP